MLVSSKSRFSMTIKAISKSSPLFNAAKLGYNCGLITREYRMDNMTNELIIKGLTLDGKQFRPSDWAERLCGVMKCFEEDTGHYGHLTYSEFVRPISIQGVKCVVVNTVLESELPIAFKFFLDFAASNKLQTIDARADASASFGA
jgi:hypothetical protein